MESLYLGKRETMDGVGGKFSKESDSSLQISATDLVVHVIG